MWEKGRILALHKVILCSRVSPILYICYVCAFFLSTEVLSYEKDLRYCRNFYQSFCHFLLLSQTLTSSTSELSLYMYMATTMLRLIYYRIGFHYVFFIYFVTKWLTMLRLSFIQLVGDLRFGSQDLSISQTKLCNTVKKELQKWAWQYRFLNLSIEVLRF